MRHRLRGEPDVRDAGEHVAGREIALYSVYDLPDANSVNAQVDRLLDYVDGTLPGAHEHLDTARAEIPAFTGFPEGLS